MPDAFCNLLLFQNILAKFSFEWVASRRRSALWLWLLAVAITCKNPLNAMSSPAWHLDEWHVDPRPVIQRSWQTLHSSPHRVALARRSSDCTVDQQAGGAYRQLAHPLPVSLARSWAMAGLRQERNFTPA